MFTELELEAFCIYENYMINTFNEKDNSIYYFISKKEKYKKYFDDALINLRKEKLENLNKI